MFFSTIDTGYYLQDGLSLKLFLFNDLFGILKTVRKKNVGLRFLEKSSIMGKTNCTKFLLSKYKMILNEILSPY